MRSNSEEREDAEEAYVKDVKDRPRIDQYRHRIDPRSISDRPQIDSRPTPNRPLITPRSIPIRAQIDLEGCRKSRFSRFAVSPPSTATSPFFHLFLSPLDAPKWCPFRVASVETQQILCDLQIAEKHAVAYRTYFGVLPGHLFQLFWSDLDKFCN